MNNEFLIPVSFFAMIYGIVYLLVRRRERLALLEKGADASVFEAARNLSSSLKWGLLLIGIGAGILIGKLLAVYTTIEEEPAYFSMVCLFGGIGLIIYHLLINRKDPSKEN